MASAMHAARAQLDTATHNLANVSSDGFRRFTSVVKMTDRGLVPIEKQTFEQGGLRRTGRDLDLAIAGRGAFRVGTSFTRNGAFLRDRSGYLADDRGRPLIGTHGKIRFPEGASVQRDGAIVVGGKTVERIPLAPGSKIITGALESSNVDAIGESLQILTAERAFETAQKTYSAIDETREKAANELGRLK